MQGANELDLHPDRMGIDKLRTLLVSTAKETAFRKVVQATMVRDRQHGPVLELNRDGIAFRRISLSTSPISLFSLSVNCTQLKGGD